jgi:cell division protein FtsW
MNFARTDRSSIARWWWTVDRWTLAALGILMAFGCLMTLAASPAVAERIGTDSFHFVRRQLALVPVALLLMFLVSLLSPRTIRRLAIAGFIVSLLLLALTFVAGAEIKGARRWINIAGFSLQPSEFIKPSFAIITGWLFAEQRIGELPGNLISIALYILVLALLLLQPDLGQAVVLSAIWFAQFFLAGLPLILVVLGTVLGAGGLVGAYFVFPHVASRIDRFIDPASGDSYQVDRSIEAFRNGGLWGRGPGEGQVKEFLPDAHADFVFAVAGEEFGLIICLLIVAVFAFVVLRGFSRLLNERNLFVVLATTGLLVQFGLQAIINMASSLHLMPTKGMTLPFLSYGGSSLLALGLGMGMVLALTRRRFGGTEAS